MQGRRAPKTCPFGWGRGGGGANPCPFNLVHGWGGGLTLRVPGPGWGATNPCPFGSSLKSFQDRPRVGGPNPCPFEDRPFAGLGGPTLVHLKTAVHLEGPQPLSIWTAQFETALSISRAPTLLHLETACHLEGFGGPQPLPIWRPPCPRVGNLCPFEGLGARVGPLETALSIWRVGGPGTLREQFCRGGG